MEINDKAEVIHSMIQGQYLTLRCRSQKRPTPAGDPSTGSNPRESGPLTGTNPRCHRKGEKSYLHTVNQQSKACATNTQQVLPINVVINSRLLNMQGYKGFDGLLPKITTKSESVLSMF
jgi:hypothetical protein